MTWQPTIGQVEAALKHAESVQPLEGCGVIAGGEFVAITNRATEHDTFSMDMREYCRIDRERGVEAIVHSHVFYPPIPSEGDRAMCEKLGLPWLIVSWPVETFIVHEPCGWRAPLVGRQWAWGSHDCLGCVRDGMKELGGIEIPDFPRDWMWWQNGGDDIAENFATAGFVSVPQGSIPQHLDVFGMQIGARVVNHLALFVEPDQILHQMMGRLSVREVYGGFYQQATVLHLRHEMLMGGRP
jgi:proteasome lid subunit RPN8/RPN11